MTIDRTALPIIYHDRINKSSVYLIGVPIANITYSETLKTYWVYFKNISDDIGEFDYLGDAKQEIENYVVKFLEDVLDINQNEQL